MRTDLVDLEVVPWWQEGAGLLDPVPHHGPYGDQCSASGHNAERNGEDRDLEGVAVLPRLQCFLFGVAPA
jgi:hypothetical protein